jgi:hypothetical protein
MSKKEEFQKYFNERFKGEKLIAISRFEETSDLVKERKKVMDCPECAQRL